MFGGLTKPRPLKTTDRLRPLPINPPGVRTDIGHVSLCLLIVSFTQKMI